VDTITSVSGGSVLAAQVAGHVAEHPDSWRPGEPVAGFDEGVVRPLEELASQDIRTHEVLRVLDPRRWGRRNVQIDALADRLERGPAGRRLSELPERPRFLFCATDANFRGQWTFDSRDKRIGGDQAGHAEVGSWTIARAAAASACLPGVFGPMRISDRLQGGAYEQPDRDTILSRIDLIDGGIYDNLGLEPVWRDHDAILVSDASPSFKPEPRIGKLWGQLRVAVTLLEQATEVRKRWLLADFTRGELKGAYWGIPSVAANYEFDPGVPVYSPGFVRDSIAPIRIDFDSFSEAERAVLQNHGYLLADVGIRRHLPELAPDAPPPRVPYEEWMDEARARDALAESDKTKLFARRWRQ
jgi:NTE family protein